MNPGGNSTLERILYVRVLEETEGKREGVELINFSLTTGLLRQTMWGQDWGVGVTILNCKLLAF